MTICYINILKEKRVDTIDLKTLEHSVDSNEPILFGVVT